MGTLNKKLSKETGPPSQSLLIKMGVAIGRILYTNPQVIIMDEPTVAISVKEREKVLNLIKSLKKSRINEGGCW